MLAQYAGAAGGLQSNAECVHQELRHIRVRLFGELAEPTAEHCDRWNGRVGDLPPKIGAKELIATGRNKMELAIVTGAATGREVGTSAQSRLDQQIAIRNWRRRKTCDLSSDECVGL